MPARSMRLALLTAALLVLTTALPATAAAPALGGTITDAAGQRVAGATVQLISAAGPLLAATTDDSGVYTLPAVDGSRPDYRLRVWAAGSTTAEATWVPAVDGSRLDLTLGALGAGLAGRVLDQAGNPLRGAAVALSQSGAGLVASATTGSDGAYAISGLAPGAAYTLTVSAPGYAAAQPVLPAVTAGRTAHVDVTLTAAFGTVSGVVVDAASGKALPARLELMRAGRGIVAEATADATGSFSLRVPAGDGYALRAWATDHATFTSAGFTLPAGGQVDLAGQAQIGLAPLYGSVSGYVVDNNGSPRAGLTVHLDRQGYGTVASASTDADGWYLFNSVPATSTPALRVRAVPGTTNTGVADSPWFSLAGSGSYEADLVVGIQGSPYYGTGTLSGRVTDGAGLPLAGVAITASRGTDMGTRYSAVTDANGHYRLDVLANKSPYQPLFGAAGYVVSAAADGYFVSDLPVAVPGAATPLATVDVTTGRVSTAHFALRATTGRIGGRVLDAAGRPLGVATVQLYRAGSLAPVATTTADGAGRYAFTGLPVLGLTAYAPRAALTGFTASALAGDGNTPVALGDAADGAGALIDLRLAPASAGISGSVQDAAGRSLAGAKITATAAESGQSVTADSGPDGTFTLDALAVGQTWLLSAAAPGYRTAALSADGSVLAPLALRPGDHPHLALQMPSAAAEISGTVYAAGGAPLGGATVQLWQEGEGPVTVVQADPFGRYRFASLAPGHRYAVSASAPGYSPSALQYGLSSVPPLIPLAGGDHAAWNPVLLPNS